MYTHVYTCIHMYAHVYTCIHMYTHVYTCIHGHIDTHMFRHIHTCVCIHTQLHIQKINTRLVLIWIGWLIRCGHLIKICEIIGTVAYYS